MVLIGLDFFQSGFRPSCGPETALITLVDDLKKDLDRSMLVLLDLSAAFDTIVFLDCLSEVWWAELSCTSSASSSQADSRRCRGVLLSPLATEIWSPPGVCVIPHAV